MTRDEMTAAISKEIVRLEQVRELLCGALSHRNGTAEPKTVTAKKTRNISDEARKRIALAQKRRWAKQRKTDVEPLSQAK